MEYHIDFNPLGNTSDTDKDQAINDNLSGLKKNAEYHVHSDTQSHCNFPVSLEAMDKVEALTAVYAELAAINKKLQIRSLILQKQTIELTQRERALQQAKALDMDSSGHSLQNNVEQKWALIIEKQQYDLEKLKVQVQGKNKEIKRMKASFDDIKEANDKLRREITKVKEQNKKLELQALSAQGRLTNLQRKQDLADRQSELKGAVSKATFETCQQMEISHEEANRRAASNQPSIKKTAAVFDVLSVLLEWLCEIHMANIETDTYKRKTQMFPPLEVLTDERCVKILPLLVEVLPRGSRKMHLSCIQFIYWTLIQLDRAQVTQKPIVHSTTYRHLGDMLFKPAVENFAVEGDGNRTEDSLKPKAAIFFRSSNLVIRFLSSLIILKTLSQADSLVKVFEVLRTDLQDDSAKEMFLSYKATQVVTPFLMVSNSALATSAVDVFLQMSVESEFMQEFLDSCSNEKWFRACATFLNKPDLSPDQWEKISVILQKLSKIKTNKRHFEVQGITRIVKEVLQMKGQVNSFLSLNLRSILFNFQK